MPHDDLPKQLALTEDQFRQVIERATRLESRDTGISLDVLRRVADDLAIEPAALERAVRDVLATPTPTASRGAWFRDPLTKLGSLLGETLRRSSRLVVGMLVGGALGWLGAHVASTVATGANAFIDVPIGLALILLTVANSLSRRVDGRFAQFVGETAAMWVAFRLAWSLTFGQGTGDLDSWVLSAVATASVWGWFVVRRGGSNGITLGHQPQPSAVEPDGARQSNHPPSPSESVRPYTTPDNAYGLALPGVLRGAT